MYFDEKLTCTGFFIGEHVLLIFMLICGLENRPVDFFRNITEEMKIKFLCFLTVE